MHCEFRLRWTWPCPFSYNPPFFSQGLPQGALKHLGHFRLRPWTLFESSGFLFLPRLSADGLLVPPPITATHVRKLSPAFILIFVLVVVTRPVFFSAALTSFTL